MYTDAIIRIKNAQMAGKSSVKVPYSKMDYSILNILKDEGYFKKVEVKGRIPGKVIFVEFNKNKLLKEVNFLSKPSVRRYRGYEDIRLRRGRVVVVSTSRGIMSGFRAKKEKVGGQILLEVR